MVVEELDDGLCKFVGLGVVEDTILQYVTFKVAHEDYRWTMREARICADFWRGLVEKPIEKPAPLRWADEPGLTFHRLPWRAAAADPARELPLWTEILSRMTNGKAFMLWVGSLFDPKADLQQYVWLYGEGQNGKGAITRVLERALGPGYSSQQPPTKDDKFWTYSLRDKRLVVFPDCNNATFVTSGLFKSLTGGDAQRIEGKGKDATTVRLTTKFMFVSNERPKLSSERADIRRAIYCELGPIQGEADPTYEDRLWAESGEFLRRCVDAYRAACPGGGPLPAVDTTQLLNWVATVEEDFEVAFEAGFERHEVEPGVEKIHRPYTRPSEMQQFLDSYFRGDERRKAGFRAYLERRFGIKSDIVESRKHGIKSERRYLGITPRATN